LNADTAREILLTHSRSSLNGKLPPNAQLTGQLTNPVCGDHVELHFEVSEEEIRDVGFNARACAICSASSSLLRETVKGMKLSSALNFSRDFEKAVLEARENIWPENLMSLSCFEHLRVNHSRRMCALLPWLVLRKTLKGFAL